MKESTRPHNLHYTKHERAALTWALELCEERIEIEEAIA